MNEIDFFEANKDKIYATAEFLCKNDSSCGVDDKFKEIRLAGAFSVLYVGVQ